MHKKPKYLLLKNRIKKRYSRLNAIKLKKELNLTIQNYRKIENP